MDTNTPVGTWTSSQSLQWSHGLPAMDTRLCLRVFLRYSEPSMEPWPPSHGYDEIARLFMRYGDPSMEPWPPSHGYRQGWLWAGVSEDAPSMEPWPPSHGYEQEDRDDREEMRPFNGAMASQPWIRMSEQDIFDNRNGFNGAMASQPWIRADFGADTRSWSTASMEPWPPSHGYAVICVSDPLNAVRLQWSHGLPAMDTRSSSGCQDRRSSLQWSHGLPAMDTAYIWPELARVKSQLQWSHGLPAMDTL